MICKACKIDTALHEWIDLGRGMKTQYHPTNFQQIAEIIESDIWEDTNVARTTQTTFDYECPLCGSVQENPL